MVAIVKTEVMSPEEYLLWETQQDGKYEYEHGEIIEMTGGTLNHNEITLMFISLLRNHLRGKGYRILGSDAKLMTKTGVYYYPDVVVSCDDRDRNAQDFLQYPCLIAEVISPSTEIRDRSIKQQNYLFIDTLQTYIIITPDAPIIEIYQRCIDQVWQYTPIAIEPTEFAQNDPLIHITSIDLKFPLSLLYENINFADR